MKFSKYLGSYVVYYHMFLGNAFVSYMYILQIKLYMDYLLLQTKNTSKNITHNQYTDEKC